jgi:hypothetical protein
MTAATILLRLARFEADWLPLSMRGGSLDLSMRGWHDSSLGVYATASGMTLALTGRAPAFPAPPK